MGKARMKNPPCESVDKVQSAARSIRGILRAVQPTEKLPAEVASGDIEEGSQGSALGALRASARVMLAARGLRKSFGGQVVLDDVDLKLRQGEVVLLRGENGSGKTTLLNVLTGNLEPDSGSIEYTADDTPRTYRFPRRWWQELNPWDHFRPEFVAMEGLGRTWQDIRLFHAQSLRDNIAVAMPGHPGENPIVALFSPGRVRQSENDIYSKADAMLARLGLGAREASSGDMVSLGQSKRVAIARAVAAGARILFLDEPLSGLDRPGVEDVLNLLEHLVRKQAVTLVVVEHVFNHMHLRDLITTDWLLKDGKLHPNGTRLAHNETRDSQAGINDRPWLKLFSDTGSSITDEVLPHGAVLTRIARKDSVKQPRESVLDIRNLVVKRGTRPVIGLDGKSRETGFSLRLFEGEIAVLQAPNGWGKSTLIATISGLVRQSRGDVLLRGQPLNGLSVWDRVRRGVLSVPSDHNVFPSLTGRDHLRLSDRGDSAFMLGSLADPTASELSGGQKQRLALARRCDQPSVHLRMFDEPFANLDASAIREAARAIYSTPHGAVLVAFPSTNDLEMPSQAKGYS